MMSKRLTVVFCVLLAVAPVGACRAQGTSGSQFLGIGIGARSAGMGGAYVSLADDGTALNWNPAGLTQVAGHRFTVSHVSWLSDSVYQHASYAAPFGRDGAVGAAIEQGSVSWDNIGEGSFSASDFCGALGYGRRLRPNLGVGGSIKYLSSALGDDKAASYAADLGIVYRMSDRTRFGAAVRNLGPGLTFRDESDPLPATLAVGGSYRWQDVTFALDVEKVNDVAMSTRVGVEYSPVACLALRGGYAAGDDSALSSFSGGFGLNWHEQWVLDYAYRPSELGGTHQVALSAGFGAGAGLTAASAAETAGEIPTSVVPKSHLTVISELTSQAAAEAIDQMKFTERSEIYLREIDESDANWLVHSVLLEELTSRGHVVMTGGMPGMTTAEGGRPTYEIAYRIVSCEATLPRAWREWVVGSRKAERKTSVDIHFRLSDNTSAIVWAGNVKKERREIIPGSRAEELGTPGQPFASPELETGGWDQVLEPLVVAAIVGGLIYLFYTSRSAD